MSPLWEVCRHVLHGVHCDVDAAGEESVIDLLGEQTLHNRETGRKTRSVPSASWRVVRPSRLNVEHHTQSLSIHVP